MLTAIWVTHASTLSLSFQSQCDIIMHGIFEEWMIRVAKTLSFLHLIFDPSSVFFLHMTDKTSEVFNISDRDEFVKKGKQCFISMRTFNFFFNPVN